MDGMARRELLEQSLTRNEAEVVPHHPGSIHPTAVAISIINSWKGPEKKQGMDPSRTPGEIRPRIRDIEIERDLVRFSDPCLSSLLLCMKPFIRYYWIGLPVLLGDLNWFTCTVYHFSLLSRIAPFLIYCSIFISISK